MHSPDPPESSPKPTAPDEPLAPRDGAAPPPVPPVPASGAAAQAASALPLKLDAAVRALEEACDPIPTTLPAPPATDSELEEVVPAAIEQAAEEPETPFDKLAGRAARYTPDRVRSILEALLLVADRPLTDEAVRQCTGLAVLAVRDGMHRLQGTFREGVSGIVLSEVAGGWQLRTDPGAAEQVRRFLKVKPHRLTRAALETMAIVAYRQPVTRPEVEEIRAVDSGAVLKALLERRLVKIIGKKEEPGRPLLYGTTREFLEFFNLKDLGSLPTLREFQELSQEHQEIVERETAVETPGTRGIVAELRDPRFEARLSETRAEADSALEELEGAITEADVKSRAAAAFLNPPQPLADPGASPPPPPAPPPEADPADEDEPPAPED